MFSAPHNSILFWLHSPELNPLLTERHYGMVRATIEYRLQILTAWFEKLEQNAMAKQGKSTPSNGFGDYTTVHSDLTAAQRTAFLAWGEPDYAYIADGLSELVGDYYKISLSFDGRRNKVLATLTGKEDQKHNAYLMLQAHHATPLQALWLVMYKHFEIAHRGDWRKAFSLSADDFG
jgi:hypothetical protein